MSDLDRALADLKRAILDDRWKLGIYLAGVWALMAAAALVSWLMGRP